MCIEFETLRSQTQFFNMPKRLQFKKQEPQGALIAHLSTMRTSVIS